MNKKQILLAGMRHHDFEPEIPDIYDRVIGQRVLLSKEDDNAWDIGMAVGAYYEGKLLAYVSGDQNKLTIRNVMQLSGREPYPCVVKKFRPKKSDNTSDMLVADITLPDGSEIIANTKPEIDPSIWANWSWDGPILPRFKEQNQLLTAVDDLMWLLKDDEPWSEYHEFDMTSIAENAWADISGDVQEKIRDIVTILSTKEDERMQEAGLELQQVMCHLNSPEVRQKVFNNLRTIAEDAKVIAAAQTQGYTVENLIPTFPKGMYQLLSGDPETFVGRTSYLKMPQLVLQKMFSGVIFLLSCFMQETKSKMKSRLPLEERVISVKMLLDLAEKSRGSELAQQLCQIILLSVPDISEKDLEKIRSIVGLQTVTGQTFKDCTFTGNNIIESIQNATKLPALPKVEPQPLLTDKNKENEI